MPKLESSQQITHQTSPASSNDLEQVSVSSGRKWTNIGTTSKYVLASIILLALANVVKGADWSVKCCVVKRPSFVDVGEEYCRSLTIPYTNETLHHVIVPYEHMMETDGSGYASCDYYKQLLAHGSNYSTFKYVSNAGGAMPVVYVVAMLGLAILEQILINF